MGGSHSAPSHEDRRSLRHADPIHAGQHWAALCPATGKCHTGIPQKSVEGLGSVTLGSASTSRRLSSQHLLPTSTLEAEITS